MQTEERVKPLNYCTQAIEQLESGMRTVRKDMPGILHAHHVLVRLLRESVKFILPNCAELVDMGEIRQAHLDLARLPFPVVALESPWVFVGNEGRTSRDATGQPSGSLCASPWDLSWLSCYLTPRDFLKRSRVAWWCTRCTGKTPRVAGSCP